MLLDEGKGWEYIGAMVQLMANKESVFLKQGLLDLGADFEADLARAAAWIEKNLRKLNEAISLVKQGRKLSGKKREEAERLGIATQIEGGEDLLADLEGLRAKFEMVGSYPDLVAQAQLYDGKTEVDPVGQLLEQQRAQREREQGLKELDAEAYLRAKQAEAVPEFGFSVEYAEDSYEPQYEDDGRYYFQPYGSAAQFMKGQKDPAPYFERDGHRVSLLGIAPGHDMYTLATQEVDDIQKRWKEWKQRALEVLEKREKPEVFARMKQSLEDSDGVVLGTLKKRIEQGVLEAPEYYTATARRKAIEPIKERAWKLRDEANRAELLYKVMKLSWVAEMLKKRGLEWRVDYSRRSSSVYFYVRKNGESGWKVRISDHNYPGVGNDNHLELRYWDSNAGIEQAIEEFAQRVEKGDFSVVDKQRKWSRVGGSESFSVTQEMADIKAAAQKDGTFMKAPNGKPTNLTERQWLQVRTKAFKEWFGDWERTAELTFKVKSITQKEADAELQKLAHVPLLNDGRYGVPAEVNREQREKLLSNNARRKSEANGFSKDEHFFLASKIQKLYKHAVCLGDYRDVNGARDVLAIRRFAAPFVVNGKRGYALLTVKITEQNYRQRGGVIVSNNEARAYSIELDELRGIDSQLQRLESLRMEKMVGFKKQFEPRGTVENVDIQDSPSPSSGEILEVFNAKVKEYFDNVSKVVDETGEPRVVYHGSLQWFQIFNDGKERHQSGAPDGRKLTDKVTEFWNKEYGGVAKNPVLGDVVLDTRSVKASIAHGVGRLKSAAFAVVHDVIEQGVLVEIAPDWKGRGEDSYVIAAPVQIGNASYVCEVVVMKGETRTGFYLHEVQIKEKLLDVFKTGVVTGTSGASKSILLDVWQRVKQIEENCSKVVDENGEPRVVYHGSLQWFQIFNDGKERHQSGAPDGTIFANDNREIAVSFVDYYGGKAEDVILDANDARHARMPWGVYRKGGIYSLFMNLKNPLVVDFEGMTWHGEKYDIKDVNWYAVEARKKGHDGLIIRNVIDVGFTDTNDVPPSTDYVAFESNQVKSATDNRGTFDGSEADITMSTEYEPRNLAAVHSLSAEKFLAALELGGMPMPSVAVTRLDRPYEWGGAGAINLIGKPELVDPRKGAEVWSRDAWTGNIPRVVHKPIGRKNREEASGDLHQMKKAYQNSSDYNSLIHQLDYRISMGYGGENTERSDMDYGLRQVAGKALFAWQSGYKPRPKMKDAVRTHEWLTKDFAERLRVYTALSPDEYHEKLPEIKELVRQEIESVYRESGVIKNAPSAEAAEKRLSPWVNVAMRAFDVYSPSVLEKELQDVKKEGARVLDIDANLEMLAKYADKHKKAYEVWVEQKLNEWFSKERYIKGTRTEATLDSLTEYMMDRKSRGKEEGLAFSSGRVRAYQAEEMRSLADIQARRDTSTDSDTSKESKEKTHELMTEWREGAAAILTRGSSSFHFTVRDDLMEILAKVKGEPTAEKVRSVARRVLRGATYLSELLNNEKVIGYGVEALKSLRAELEDYMEAVPQRAVKMNEWVYAVMPKSLQKNKAVMAGLRENGIRPRFHDGTEEGRRAALAKLVDDSKVSFNVVGEHAANWDELKERAFRGRDDGKLRVELDASQAKLKSGKHGQDAKVLAPRFRALVEFIREKIHANRRWNAVVTDWKDNVPSIDSWEEVSFVRRVLEQAGITYQNLGALVDSGILLAVLESKEEHIGAFLDKVERIDSLSGFDALEDVLDYPELYKAYPQLRKVPILWKKDAANRGLTTLSGTGDVWITVRDGEDAERTLSTLLHETQHVIQFIEGFAVGGAGGFADMRAWMSDNGYLDQSLLLTNAELYRRLAGEIEARNVQKRAGWDANVRQYYIPFNDTLEYAGQAIVIKASDLGYDNVSLSLTVEAQNALHLLEKRRDEVEAQVILEDMQKACERLSVVLAADDDPQVGNGLQVYAEMQALISATRKALPGKYLRQGNLNGLLAWAGVYARMAHVHKNPASLILAGFFSADREGFEPSVRF